VDRIDSQKSSGIGTYLKTVDSEWYKQRLTGAMVCVLAAFLVLFARLFYLQVLEGEELRRLSENNCIRLQDIDPPRGLIFDRQARLLVENRPAYNLSIIPKDAKPVDQTLARLSHYIKVPLADLLAAVEKKHGYAYKPILLRQDIGRDTLAAIEVHKYDLPGIVVSVKPRRHYIDRFSAAHLIGYLSEINGKELRSGRYPGTRSGDFIGKFGVEKTYETYLRGEHGGRQVEVDARGRVVRQLKTVYARPGHNLFLTVDQRLQKKAEALLSDRVGAVAAMDPKTGEILAMVSSPSFDQNIFVDGMSHDQWQALATNIYRPMENKAIQAEYPPASTYKIITAIAALEEGVIDEKTTMFCPGHLKYGDRVFRCWKKRGHGKVNVVDALAESCDVFFYQVGQRLGIDRLAWYAAACGLGTPTGIEMDHEARGLVPSTAWKRRRLGKPWHKGETLSVAIGQGYNLVTPLQMLGVTAAVANGGTRFRPRILKSIRTAQGAVVTHNRPQVIGRLPVSKKTMDVVRRGLWEVVNTPRGTASRSRVPGIAISGKTGTAQVVSLAPDNDDGKKRPALAHHKDHAWFVAYAPSDAPRIAVAVIVEHGEHGSSAAAPIARELIRTYLQPDGPDAVRTATAGQGTAGAG
jgi:penicillin-binding protein 2